MDRIAETANVITEINKYRKNQIQDYDLIKSVCTFFDRIKDEKIGQADLQFLRHVANITGIPHFYDLLSKFNHQTGIEEYSLSAFSSLCYEATLHTTVEKKVHKYQKYILDMFVPGKLNRFFLSASTSFGKTYIVFEIIKKMDYKNVVLIFPTIALLSENLERVISDVDYSYFKDNFSIHTLSEVTTFKDRNLFIYTPERFLSFIEKSEHNIDFDFAFIDEVYKIDNEYIIDEELRENERDVAYRLAVFYSLKKNVDVLLAGPYIDFYKSEDDNYNSSFNNFLKEYKIELLDYNNYEIVNKTFRDIKNRKVYEIDDDLKFDFEDTTKDKRLIQIVDAISKIGENAIVYCYSKASVESYAKKTLAENIFSSHDFENYSEFITHISNKFDKDWVVVQAIKQGIGIHHGLIPKYIQKEIISLFNKNKLKILISTTTITEGVNTSAKNLVVLHSKKGTKPLKKFDAKNIAGRAGRFLYHYSGRVIVLQNDFMNAINSTSDGIKHKNFDLDSPKDEIDLFYSGDEYLSISDKSRKANVYNEQSVRNLPEYLFSQFKVVSRIDKIKVYDEITKLSKSDLRAIARLITRINLPKMDIDYDGFRIILQVIEPIIKNQNVRFLIEQKDKKSQNSILTNLVHYYLIGGFIGSMRYKIDKQGESIDKAIRDTADFIYNTLKYQVVKYLGVFNIMYKYYQSQALSKSFDEIAGIEKLLTKFEYNALSENGRIASDYGVPASIVDYYEDTNNSTAIKEKFDEYELQVFNKIDKIINKQ